MSEGRFCDDYGKRAAKCKMSKCKQTIEKGSLRIAKIVKNPFSEEELKKADRRFGQDKFRRRGGSAYNNFSAHDEYAGADPEDWPEEIDPYGYNEGEAEQMEYD